MLAVVVALAAGARSASLLDIDGHRLGHEVGVGAVLLDDVRDVVADDCREPLRLLDPFGLVADPDRRT